MQRIATLEKNEEERQKDQAFHEQLRQDAERLEQQTSRKRAKRQKSKQAKRRRKNLQQAGIAIEGEKCHAMDEKQREIADDGDEDATSIGKKEEDDEFPMMPLPQAPSAKQHASLTTDEQDAEAPTATNKDDDDDDSSSGSLSPAVPFANDGSFLAMAKKKLAVSTSKEE